MTELDALLEGPLPPEGFAILQLWEGPSLIGVYEQEWAEAEATAEARLAAVRDALDARWGPHRKVGMRVPIFRASRDTLMPPFFQALVDRYLLGDLAVWGPVGDQARYVGVSLNQSDGDAPMIVAAAVSEHPIVELEDEDD
ncbi:MULTISPECIES: hypothetical protein [Streptomyces]|uniref:Uncharacterized protein n=1 Tax=Streptomyces solicathayae TaxID=3081768 RepID=A0ABZ0LVI3_9ACTN|nr:hypothetical protein [Streptomyces sp. HUAS YS2]WOX22799.1 hypothetical protein R2D22_15890 [Streptomyces sp. HUAS YS2]